MFAIKRFLTFRRGRINVQKEIKKQFRIRNRLEKNIQKKLNTIFRTSLKKASNELLLTNDFDQQSYIEETFKKIELVMLKHYRKVFRVIYQNNEEQYDKGKKDQEVFVFGRSKDFERMIEQYFRSRVPYFANMSNVLSKAILRKIQQGRADDLNLSQIQRQIDSLTSIGRSRAALIARTETHNAASFANHSYHQSLSQDNGIKLQKRWVSTNDARTRSAHALANGQTVEMEDDFVVDGMPMEFAGDPKGGAKNVINCRCIIIYADPEDTLEDDFAYSSIDDTPATPILDDDIDISPENQQRVLGRFVPFGTPPEKIREMIREATESSVVKIDDIFGATLSKELEWHKSVKHWLGETNIINSLKKVSPLKKIINKGSTPNFHKRDGTPTINMARAKSTKNKVSLVTWRHEYGHHIDFDDNLVNKYALKRTAFNRQGSDSSLRGLSREASNDVIEDSVLLLKQKAEARQRIKLYYSNDLTDFEIDKLLDSINYNDKVWSDSFLRKFGLAVQQKEFREEVIDGITKRKRVGLAEKLQRQGSLDNLQETVKNLIDNSANSPFKYSDLQSMFGNDFVIKLDKLGSKGYKYLVDIVAKLQTGYQGGLYNQLVVMAKELTKNNHVFGMEALYFSDYLGSISRSKFTKGHGSRYYIDKSAFDTDFRIPVDIKNLSDEAKILLKEEFGGSVVQSMTTEAFANYISLLGGSNAKFWRRLMMQYAPSTTKKFDEIIKFINTTQI